MIPQHSIHYVEFVSTDFAATKEFYGTVFGWKFQDWGDDYISFSEAVVEGGFHKDLESRKPSRDGALVILYSHDLEATLDSVKSAGAEVTTEPFSFPGGRRFHFLDPSGNELAVWTKADE